MESGAIHHFPPMRVRPERKELWNRIERKSLQIQPEERVRLSYIDHLTLECDWPTSRIATEQTLPRTETSSALRADIICFDRQFNPEILIECKAESVRLNLDTAEQIARYNREITAPLLCITNGVEDFWFRVERNGSETLTESPLTPSRTLEEIRSDTDYWRERGFIGFNQTGPETGWIAKALSSFWSDRLSWPASWVPAGKSTPEVHLDHTYRILELGSEEEIAATLMGGTDGGTWLVGLFNRSGETRAVAGCNLERLRQQTSPDSWRIDVNGRREFSLSEREAFRPDGDPDQWIDRLPDLLDALVARNSA